MKAIKSAIENAHQGTVSRLQQEVKQLKDINADLQEKYRQKHVDYKEKVSQMASENVPESRGMASLMPVTMIMLLARKMAFMKQFTSIITTHC